MMSDKLRRSLAAVLLTAAAALTVITGCGNKNSSSSAVRSSKTTTAPTQNTAAYSSEEVTAADVTKTSAATTTAAATKKSSRTTTAVTTKKDRSTTTTAVTTKKSKKTTTKKAVTTTSPSFSDYEESGYVEYTFRNDKLLNQHFEKHGSEFDGDFNYRTAKEYEQGASDVINDPDALFKYEAEDGDGVYYIEETNEFVILSKDGYIRTYFRPNGGKSYFDRQ